MASNDGGGAYLPEDLAIGILLSLPSGSSIARCRCVCRSWRNLLSDPNFLRKIISFKTPDVQKSLQILLTGRRIADSYLRSSLISYETLNPIPPSSGIADSPSKLYIGNHDVVTPTIVGCCNGIVCVLVLPKRKRKVYAPPQINYLQTHPSEIVLWNPATSEAKTIPSRRFEFNELVGFGFDPLTKDYKVVQVLQTREFGGSTSPAVVNAEVYSLRNDSWKAMRVRQNPFDGRYKYDFVHVHQQPDTSRDDKCYWFGLDGGSLASNDEERKKRLQSPCDVISFDMTAEEFSSVHVPPPGGLDKRNAWIVESCFMSKGVFVATFECRKPANQGDYKETWALLKCGVAESWIKLSTFEPPLVRPFWHVLDLWKDGMYICSYRNIHTGPDKVISYEPATKEVIHDRLEIEGTYGFHAYTFVPTRVPLISETRVPLISKSWRSWYRV